MIPIMNERYERFNAMTFEAYCKISIDRAVNRGRRQRKVKAQHETSLTDIPEDVLVASNAELEAFAGEKDAITVFTVGEVEIAVHNEALAQALRTLTPQRRAILLLAYFLDESDMEIGTSLNLPRSTVQKRRNAALNMRDCASVI